MMNRKNGLIYTWKYLYLKIYFVRFLIASAAVVTIAEYNLYLLDNAECIKELPISVNVIQFDTMYNMEYMCVR